MFFWAIVLQGKVVNRTPKCRKFALKFQNEIRYLQIVKRNSDLAAKIARLAYTGLLSTENSTSLIVALFTSFMRSSVMVEGGIATGSKRNS